MQVLIVWIFNTTTLEMSFLLSNKKRPLFVNFSIPHCGIFLSHCSIPLVGMRLHTCCGYEILKT
jgi:hypothetical protein